VLINVSVIQKMIKKAAIYQLMTNFDEKLKSEKVQLTHRDLSDGTGRAETWFNNSFRNVEDLQISSFLRILAVANVSHKEKTETEIDGAFLSDIFTSKVFETASLINDVAMENDAHLLALDFVQSKKKLFQDLVTYWGILSGNNKLDAAEEEALKEIRSILNTDSDAEQEEDNEQ
jgi:predicted MPP superfamily phosphohydrolase